MTRRFKTALFTESSGFCRSFYSLNLRVLILISLVTSLPSQGLAGGLSEVIEGVGVDLSYCFVLSTGCLQCAEYYLTSKNSGPDQQEIRQSCCWSPERAAWLAGWENTTGVRADSLRPAL